MGGKLDLSHKGQYRILKIIVWPERDVVRGEWKKKVMRNFDIFNLHQILYH
jgi:hypothetical protein